MICVIHHRAAHGNRTERETHGQKGHFAIKEKRGITINSSMMSPSGLRTFISENPSFARLDLGIQTKSHENKRRVVERRYPLPAIR